MNISSVAVNAVINYLLSVPSLTGRVIVPEFDSRISPVAISEPVFSVGVESFHAAEEFEKDETTGNTVATGRMVYKLKMRICVYVSFANGAERSFIAADYIYSMLMNPEFRYKISEIFFDAAEYDSKTESIRMTTHFTVEGTF